MRLTELLKGFTYTTEKETDINITEVVYDSRKIVPGCMFICISGAVYDGHKFAAQAAENGAAVIVAEKQVEVPAGVPVIYTDDTRYAMAFISAAWFGHPAKELKTIGITGTKGKTTTTYMVKSILEQTGAKAGLIGTIETIIDNQAFPAANTTPESYTIHETFRKMADAGCEYVVMEVSSQGLMLHRTAGILFDIGIFTNLAEDHIGPAEHKDFEDYMNCKSLLFRQCRHGIVNIDDDHIEGILKGHTCDIVTFGFAQDADYNASDVELVSEPGYLGVKYKVSGRDQFNVELDIPGRFSVYNSLTAIAVCRHFNVETYKIRAALKVAKVKGRIEIVEVSDDYTLMIDYAHNAMSLESLLLTLKDYQPSRLVCVFGCGGNRSKARRYEMGEVSGRLADLTVITSDNPRFEEPQDIIDDIKIGIGKTEGQYVEIIDRAQAIEYVVRNGQKGDVIVIAGKGHEDYQEIKGKKYPMDDRILITQALKAL